MPRELADRLKVFRQEHFPRYKERYRLLAERGQQPGTLFIGCSDARVLPDLLMDAKPGEVFTVRNVGNLVPPYEDAYGYHGTSAAIEFAVLALRVRDIVVCGHSHCGAIRALYQSPPEEARHMNKWLDLAREAVLPVTESEEALRRVEQRSVVLQLEHLLTFPMVARRVERGELFLHGWHYHVGSGRVEILDVARGEFVAEGEDAA
ncbi:MAG: carbonic anhydrase [Burkholderiales bacterium]